MALYITPEKLYRSHGEKHWTSPDVCCSSSIKMLPETNSDVNIPAFPCFDKLLIPNIFPPLVDTPLDSSWKKHSIFNDSIGSIKIKVKIYENNCLSLCSKESHHIAIFLSSLLSIQSIATKWPPNCFQTSTRIKFHQQIIDFPLKVLRQINSVLKYRALLVWQFKI